jgi:hypothetical protein
MNPPYKHGDLIEVSRCDGWTIHVLTGGTLREMREFPVREVVIYTHPRMAGNLYASLEGKVGLVVYVKRNLLLQPVGYRVLIEGNEMFCKSKVAHKYFKLLETPPDESRRFS